MTYIGLTGNIVEVDPSAVISCNDSFCTKDHSEAIAICKALKSGFELGFVEFFGCFCAVAYKHFVGVMMLVVVVTALTVMVVMLVVVVTALTVMVMMLVVVVTALTVVVMMLVFMMTALTVVVMMLVVVVTALTVVVMMLVVVVTALAVMVMMLVVVVTALAVMMMHLVMMRLFLKMLKLGGESRSMLHRLDDLCTRKLIPRCRDDHSTRIVISYKSNAFADFGIRNRFGVAKNDASRVLYLIVEKFTKIFHVHFTLVGIHNGRSTVEFCAVRVRIFYSRNNVGKLTHARGLDKDSVGMILVYNLFERFCKIANQ